MPNLLDLTGDRYGRLVVLRRGPNSSTDKTRWFVRCDCGTEKLVLTAEMRTLKTVSCGCKRSTTHGHTSRGVTTTEYRIWQGMIRRCTNPRYAHWARYGGRGITICDRWRAFANFVC